MSNTSYSFNTNTHDSGWKVSSTFFEFIANVFYPWILEDHIKLPTLLFLDGHKSHISMEMSKFCSERGIILYCLLPNVTHILQPYDVAIFKSLKDQWRKAVSDHKQKTNKSVIKSNFAILFKTTFEVAICPEVIKKGFRVYGLSR
nr:unnamed protein product [Callosobruchus chinensis]